MHPTTDHASTTAEQTRERGRARTWQAGGALVPAPRGALLALLLAVLVQCGLLALLLLSSTPDAWVPFRR